ncbi:MAG: archease [Candidatus Micrarchaeales archaeon]|nr:archease [Candidatus Micrarchaeales archaeon]
MAQKGYEYVEHTADVEFVARGRTIEAAFKNAFLAMFNTMAEIGKLSKSKAKTQELTINDKARTLEDLLWFGLQDALSVTDAEGVYAYGIASLSISVSMGEYNINAVLKAKKKEQKFSKLDVKGVSQFDLKIVKSAKGYGISVVLDV